MPRRFFAAFKMLEQLTHVKDLIVVRWSARKGFGDGSRNSNTSARALRLLKPCAIILHGVEYFQWLKISHGPAHLTRLAHVHWGLYCGIGMRTMD